MHRSSNSTVFTDPAITKSTKPDTGVPIWLDIVIGVSFGITVVGCLFIFLHRRNLRTNDPWIMSHKEVDFTSYEAKKQDQYDDFVAGACGAGYGIYATMKTNFRYVKSMGRRTAQINGYPVCYKDGSIYHVHRVFFSFPYSVGSAILSLLVYSLKQFHNHSSLSLILLEMLTDFLSIYSPSWSYDASNAGRWYDEDRHPQSRGIVDRRIIQPLQAVKLAP
ncbi:hypothetical protein MMC11_003083 [Xylographa trunciseda]|nr:hypothetical protein [Xylographa trunciseda]